MLTEERVEWVILGKGSNVLVSDDGYDGCVILLDDSSRASPSAPRTRSSPPARVPSSPAW